jgi:hypothetical protein
MASETQIKEADVRIATMATTVGIDPGLSGGIALIGQSGAVHAWKMPATERDLFDLFAEYNLSENATAHIEKVNAGPKMGSSAAFKFGQNVGHIRMACIAAGLRLEYVTPQKWQKEFGLIVKGRGLGQDDTSKKNRNKARAQELFPGIKITHWIADALLIAEYGRRQISAPPARQATLKQT